jgi:hypothetical protein
MAATSQSSLSPKRRHITNIWRFITKAFPPLCLALSTSIEDSYLKAGDAILNKSDSLFQNGTSANPTILIPTDSYSIGLALNNDRVGITTRLNQWKADLAASARPRAVISYAESLNDLSVHKKFLGSL